MGHLTLAAFCEDGEEFIHEIGNGDPRYTIQETNDEFAMVQAEIARKGLGPPTCAHYDRERGPGVCDGCAFKSLVTSPLQLGREVPTPVGAVTVAAKPGAVIAWPSGYMQDADGVWRVPNRGDPPALITEGEITDISVTHDHQQFVINFLYTFGCKTYAVTVRNDEAVADGAILAKQFAKSNITILPTRAKMLGELLVAFINSMRKAQLAQNDEVHPFGFAVDDKKQHIGVAVGGILYRSDGTRDRVPGLQPAIEAGFQPQGSLDHWKNTFKTVCGGRPELQALVAGSFGAPLMHFTGEKGVTISGWTPESGAAKSSAMTLAQTVWSEPRFMSSMNDTDNMAARLRSVCAFMPSIWDEKLDDKTKAKEFTQLIFSIAQG
jgi:hypothetical protein